MRILFLMVLWLTTSAIYSQKPPIKFGDIEKADLQLESYPQDPSADAVILNDFGHAYFDYNSSGVDLKFVHHVRVKILNENGYKWADVNIPYAHNGRVEALKAATYNLEGGKVVSHKLEKDGIFEEKTSKWVRTKKFTLPNVKEGSVIEYSYRISAGNWLFFKSWEFQHEIPIRHSEYWAEIPDYFQYKNLMQGYLTVSDYNVTSHNTQLGPGKRHRWVIADVPALRKEPYINSVRNYQSRIDFELSTLNLPGDFVRPVMPSYASINKELLEEEEFGKRLHNGKFLDEKVQQLLNGVEDPTEKIRILYDYVNQNIRWNNKYGIFTSKNLKKVFQDKEGNAADNNLLLVLMLRQAGFDANGVIISTRQNGIINPIYPNIQKFNYTLAHVQLDDKSMVMDATDPLRAYDVLPPRSINGRGRLISDTNPDWVDIENAERQAVYTRGVLQLDEDGVLDGSISQNCSSFAAWELRKDIDSLGMQAYQSDLKSEHASWKISGHQVEQLENINESLVETYQVKVDDMAQVAGSMMYLNCLLGNGLKSNPFNSEERLYPIDYICPIDEFHSFTIKLPEGYVVEELPQNVKLVLPDMAGSYTLGFSQMDHSINISSRFSIKKRRFFVDEYPVLREFYTQVLSKQAEQIVIKKL